MSLFGTNPLGTSTPTKPGGLFSSFATSSPGFGNPATSAAPTSAFGSPSAFGTTSFGAAPTTSAPTLGVFGGFGNQANKTTTAPTLGGFGGFGTPATSNAPTTSAPLFGGFGSTATSSAAPAFGGFGSNTGSTAPAFGGFGGFGSTTSSSLPTFGGFGGQTNTFAGFNAPGTVAGNFPKLSSGTSVTPGFGGFGNTNFMMGHQQQLAPPISPDDAFKQAVSSVNIYGGERDKILAKWNAIQASWGEGKLYYSQNAPPTDVTPANVLSRFKAIAYSRLPGKENKAGLVAIEFNKPLEDIRNQRDQIAKAIGNLLGGKSTLSVHIDSNRETLSKRTQLVIYVEEKINLAAHPKRILATELASFLSQNHIKNQLSGMGACDIVTLVSPDEDQLKEYLELAPKGIDEHLWHQAQKDNPDPKLFIPVPLIGFNDLKTRMKCQENEIEMHSLYLEKLEQDIAKLHERHRIATARILEHKRMAVELNHRILKVIIKQECTRKYGMPLTAQEEALKTKLENMQAVVSAPTQFKGRISELLSQMRMQKNQFVGATGNDYTIEKDSEEEIQTFLYLQQKAIEVIMDTVTNDTKAIQLMLDDFKAFGNK